MAYQGGADVATAPAGDAPVASHDERKLQKQVNDEFHNPYDDWSVRDILLSLVPFIVTYAFKDVSLRAALVFATAASWFILISRTVAYDSRRKHIWPLIDIAGCVAFPILLGMTYVNYYQITKWWNVIIPGVLAFSILLSLLWRRPFSAHYARYPKFDIGGSGVWHGDGSFRRTSDIITMVWFMAFLIMLFLSLIPIMLGYWVKWHALNIIFNYVVPALCLFGGLIMHQLMGLWYRSSAMKHTTATTTTTTSEGPAGVRGAAYPAGMTTEGAAGGTPATYSSTAV